MPIFMSVFMVRRKNEVNSEGLEKAKGFIRKLLGERISVYHTGIKFPGMTNLWSMVPIK